MLALGFRVGFRVYVLGVVQWQGSQWIEISGLLGGVWGGVGGDSILMKVEAYKFKGGFGVWGFQE